MRLKDDIVNSHIRTTKNGRVSFWFYLKRKIGYIFS